MAEIGDIWYRYYDGQQSIELAEYTVVKVTPKCVYVYECPGSREYWDMEHLLKFAKRVLKDARKRHCYPTRELAAESFRIRRQHQIEYIKSALEKCELMLKLAGTTGDIPANSVGSMAALDSVFTVQYNFNSLFEAQGNG